MRHWIFSCKQTSRMISESMDRKLPLFQRMGIRFHLMMCTFCKRYQKQLIFIREALRSERESGDCDYSSSELSDKARKRIQKNILDKTRHSD